MSKLMPLLSLLFLATVSLYGQRPNVVMIYTDDHRYSGIHALGGMQVKTPHMDALAKEGASFSNAYIMGSFSGATCIPSRAMLLTGRNLFELKGKGHIIPKEHATMGETFGRAGYHTEVIGKWHQDNASLARSFDDGKTIMGRGVYLVDHFRMPLWDWDEDGRFAHEDAYLLTYGKTNTLERRPLSERDQRGPVGTHTDGPHTSEIFAGEAVSFIEQYQKETPFFMYLAFHAPHDPRQAPPAYLAMYPSDEIVLPPSYQPQHPFDNGHMFLRDEQLAPWPRSPEIARDELAGYYAIITHLDDQIGKVVTALKASGTYENTIIVLAGDSGLAVGNHGLMGKQNIYDEDGVHIPLIFSGNLIPEKDSNHEAFVYNFDIFPTLCAMAGIPVPESVSGKNLLPVMEGKQAGVRDHTYHAYRQFQRACRSGDYKLIEYVRSPDKDWKRGDIVTGSRVTQLFNVASDPWEVYDLSFLPEHSERIDKMRQQMRSMATELGDYKENIEGEKYDFWDVYEKR
ncbi:sulfatase-like hydrolase/transferase [Neolewinella agarilytica]|uniref:sulfatase-like hydrolase/transferase n=1 Tax=Neolewinella agarilytica TaxID=478744 RepID=UPI0023524938|nr:sulfatase-like hydrolase/transferase [Neolewinella agarilytica]